MAPRVVSIEEKRLEILLAPAVLRISVVEACELYGVSSKWFYKWQKRYEDEGMLGLAERSRRPLSSPKKIPDSMELVICQMRTEHPKWGPRRIRAEILRGGGSPPVKSTIQQVLVRNGLISPKPRRKKRYIRFERPSPNELWQIDAREDELADKTPVHAINILDDHARYLIASRATFVLDGEAAWDAFEQGTFDHGCPREVLTDNGGYFSGANRDAVAEFERRLWDLGIKTIASSPKHPQTLGKLERQNRTQKEWVEEKSPIKTIADYQRVLDAYRWHYNQERPNQGIDDATPAERYQAKPKVGPSGQQMSRSVRRKVDKVGRVTYCRWIVNVSVEWAGTTVEVIESARKVRILCGSELITSFSTDQPKGYIGTGLPRGGIGLSVTRRLKDR